MMKLEMMVGEDDDDDDNDVCRLQQQQEMSNLRKSLNAMFN